MAAVVGKMSSDVLRYDPIKGSDAATTKHLDRIPNRNNGLNFKTSIPQQPITEIRQPYVPKDGDPLLDAGTARATIAASKESPNGTPGWAETHQHQTVVQQHTDYWDFDKDGIIWPQDTYIGCRQWGWAPPLCAFVVLVIHLNLSYPTVPGYLPDPFFRIYLDKMYKDKHGSDSMTYDNEGRFKPQNFEDIFAKYDRGKKGGLSFGDLLDFWKGQRMVFDFFGWTASILEWVATYLLLWPDDGIMRKEDIRMVYDGSIFQKKADEYQRKQRVMRNLRQSSTSPSLVQSVQKHL
ncbi:hypothetical protein MMC19_002319 [Ptychographa xylographoides]|nr:hypothetical protein [Ptychographa xylographoides]